MEQEDQDGDGFVSWEEFGGPKGASTPEAPPNLFEELDVSPRDGKLSPDEVLAHFKKQNPSITSLPDGTVEEEDRDGDGFISWEEFRGPKGASPPKDEL